MQLERNKNNNSDLEPSIQNITKYVFFFFVCIYILPFCVFSSHVNETSKYTKANPESANSTKGEERNILSMKGGERERET